MFKSKALLVGALCAMCSLAYAEGMNQDRKESQRQEMKKDQASRSYYSKSTVKEAQRKLNDQGHDLVVDGKWGPQTKKALKEFQEDNGLIQSGRINAETLSALRIQADESTRMPASVPNRQNEENNNMTY